MATLKQLFSLEGRTAVVSGGAGWLGSAVTEALAEAGAEVYICVRDEAGAARFIASLGEFGSRVRAVPCDIEQEESIRLAVRHVLERAGKVDVMVNNAYSGASAPMEEMTSEEWNRAFAGGSHQVFAFMQEVLPAMRRQGRGSIINISTMYASVAPDPRLYEGDCARYVNPPNYGASKAAIEQLTRYAAARFGADGVRVNAIAPGPFPKPEVQSDRTFVERLAERNPLGRVGDPDDLKGAVVWLASDASSFVTGQTIRIDGGWTIW
jgi:gluconate 5-dehydrogenase